MSEPTLVSTGNEKIEIAIGIALILAQVASAAYQIHTGRRIDIMSKLKEKLQ